MRPVRRLPAALAAMLFVLVLPSTATPKDATQQFFEARLVQDRLTI